MRRAERMSTYGEVVRLDVRTGGELDSHVTVVVGVLTNGRDLRVQGGKEEPGLLLGCGVGTGRTVVRGRGKQRRAEITKRSTAKGEEGSPVHPPQKSVCLEKLRFSFRQSPVQTREAIATEFHETTSTDTYKHLRGVGAPRGRLTRERWTISTRDSRSSRDQKTSNGRNATAARHRAPYEV